MRNEWANERWLGAGQVVVSIRSTKQGEKEVKGKWQGTIEVWAAEVVLRRWDSKFERRKYLGENVLGRELLAPQQSPWPNPLHLLTKLMKVWNSGGMVLLTTLEDWSLYEGWFQLHLLGGFVHFHKSMSSFLIFQWNNKTFLTESF